MEEITSKASLDSKLEQHESLFVLLMKSGSEQSECAMKHFREFSSESSDHTLFYVDVNNTRDIHSAYNITSVPVLMAFRDGKLLNTFKGCNSAVFYRNVAEGVSFRAVSDGESSQPAVTVYTTPSCSWCTRLKSYLNKNGIRYTEVNVAADPDAAETLVRQTGQQGVPQSNIGGEWIVGFDKARIDRLLNTH